MNIPKIIQSIYLDSPRPSRALAPHECLSPTFPLSLVALTASVQRSFVACVSSSASPKSPLFFLSPPPPPWPDHHLRRRCYTDDTVYGWCSVFLLQCAPPRAFLRLFLTFAAIARLFSSVRPRATQELQSVRDLCASRSRGICANYFISTQRGANVLAHFIYLFFHLLRLKNLFLSLNSWNKKKDSHVIKSV